MAPRFFFSVIIPTFNSEIYIEECLNSIFIQTFTDYEIIIVDKYSNDKTSEIVNKKRIKQQNISFFVSRDNGIYDAMNKGVSFSKGKWIYFMGSDDRFFDENVLQLVYQKIQISKTKFIYGNVIFRYSQTKYGEKFNLAKLIEEKNICHQGIFYEKSVFSQIGKYNVKCKVYADRDFNIRCFMNRKFTRPIYINSTIAYYNEVDGFSAKNEDHYFRKLQGIYLSELQKTIIYKVINTIKKIQFTVNAIYRNL